MSILKGFWSYVHADDKAEGGRICHLAKDLADQYEALSGDTVQLFVDKDKIKWGDNWRNEINSNLAATAFFIPVFSPRYFMSPECRNEMYIVLRKVNEFKLNNIVLPLLYYDVSSLYEQSPTDDLIKLIQPIQREDWREARFFDITSGEYRKAVFRLATRLYEANRQTEKAPSSIGPLVPKEIEIAVDNSPGIIDKLATLEETFPKINETLQLITKEIGTMGIFTQEATADIEKGKKQQKGFVATLFVTRRFAVQISEPTDRIWTLSNKYASQLHDIDEGIRILIKRAPEEIRENTEYKKIYCDLFISIQTLSASAHVGLASILGMSKASEPLEKMSRDLRPVIRRLRQGLTILVESGNVMDEWVQLIESSGITCEGAGSAA
jgi:hypothetical protein